MESSEELLILFYVFVKATEQYFPYFLAMYKVVLHFESVDEILKCDHPNKSY